MTGPCRAPLPSSRPTPSGLVGVGHNHSPHEATDQPARRAKPSAPRSADRGSKPPPTVPDRSREVKVHYGRAEFATFGGGGVDRRRRGGIQSRARPSPPAPRACCVASPAANRSPASCRHLSGRSHQARLATRDTPDDPARSARASARGASGARAAASPPLATAAATARGSALYRSDGGG